MFYSTQDKVFKKIKMYQEEVAQVYFPDEDCPLLVSKIQEAEVLINRLGYNLQELKESLKSK